MTVVFFGASKYVLPILEVLRKRNEPTLVVTTEKNPTDAVPTYCTTHNIAYVSLSNLSDPTINYQLSTINSKVGVLAYFGLILPKSVLDLFPKGILNVHPSLLPKYRGPTPVQTAILNGEATTGVTLIRLDEKVDHGPILIQVKEPILPTDTAETLYERLFTVGAKLLYQNIDKYIKGELKQSLQNDAKATFTNRLSRKDGFIDLGNPPDAQTLDRMVRAFYPWPGAWTQIRLKGKGVRVKLLPGKKMQVEAGKPMSYKDFLNGYPEASSFVSTLYRA